jgi:hypothetical protein
VLAHTRETSSKLAILIRQEAAEVRFPITRRLLQTWSSKLNVTCIDLAFYKKLVLQDSASGWCTGSDPGLGGGVMEAAPTAMTRESL